MGRLLRAWAILRQRGISYLGYLVTEYLVPKISYSVLQRFSRFPLRRIAKAGILLLLVLSGASLVLTLDPWAAALIMLGLSIAVSVTIIWVRRNNFENRMRQAEALTKAARQGSYGNAFTVWSTWPVDLTTRAEIDALRASDMAKEVVIGHIDNDGRVLGVFGSLPGFVNISRTDYVKRYRFPLDIVVLDGYVLVRKDFQGDLSRLVREWHCLTSLWGKANVPSVYKVDKEKCLLYKNLIIGWTLRDTLVEAGASILNVQTDQDPELNGVEQATRLGMILARGTSLIPSTLSQQILCEMEYQLDRVHASGITGVSLTFGNVMIDFKSKSPWFIDFEGAGTHASLSSLSFRYKRNQDRLKFNKIYGRDLITEESARDLLAAQSAKLGGWYAPIDFGDGLAVGSFWSVDNGTGRWDYLNGRVLEPLVAGKRILDLGSNNGLLPLLMLRAGARQVVGLEISPGFAEAAQTVHRVFEWRDMRSYDLRMINCDMLEVLRADWGDFDMVTAFCTLYYLGHQDMASVVRKAAEMAPLIVVQANVETRREAADDKSEKSSLSFLHKLLLDNGFPHVDVHAPKGFSRPILVGRRAAVTRRPLQLVTNEREVAL
jgi:SAM-dependent methyltransferase